MDPLESLPPGEPGRRRGHHRKRRSFWKRRRFWIALLSILAAIAMALWLISTLGGGRGDVD